MSIYIPNAIQTVERDFAPQYEPMGSDVPLPLRQDPDGNLLTRGPVLTDEGTVRVNFANTSLAVAIGSITLTNGSNVLTGSNFAQYDLHTGDYVKLDADAESAWAQIDYFESPNRAILTANYTGTGGTSAGSRAFFRPYTGSGGSLAVASGQLTIGSGGTASSITGVERELDYSPLVFRSRLSISQRVANQQIRIGLKDPSATVKYFARFVASGTTNTVIDCVTGRNPTTTPSAAETQTTTITLPRGVTTANANEYRIEQLTEVCRFYINNVLVATHSNIIVHQADILEAQVEVENTGAASNTNIIVDYITAKNHNKLEIGILSDSEQIVAVTPTLEIANFSQAGVISINTNILIIDCSQLRTVNLQATSIGTTGRLDFFLTNDLSVTGTAQPAYPIGGGTPVTTTTATGHWNIPTNGSAYLRVRMGVATTAGTTTVFATGSQVPHPIPLPTTQPVSGTVTANIGTGSIAAGTNAIGDVGQQYRANATGAGTVTNINCPATPAVQTIKASAGRLIGIYLTNTNASTRWLKVWNTASGSITLGTTAALFQVPLPQNQPVYIAFEGGIAMGTAINIAITGGAGLTNNTAVTLDDVTGFSVHA